MDGFDEVRSFVAALLRMTWERERTLVGLWVGEGVGSCLRLSKDKGRHPHPNLPPS